MRSAQRPIFASAASFCRPILTGLLLVLVSASAAISAPARGGVAATAHPLATDAAIEMLEHGGNAIDAAVAAAFAIGVVEPDGSGLGGGGGILAYLHESRRTIYINYYHQAPGDPGAVSFDSGKDRNTAKAVLVPGTAAGLCLALEEYGTLPLEVVIEPALRCARDGFPIDATLGGLLLDNMEALAAQPELAEVFLTDGFPKMEGDLLVQPDLARVLQLISDHGRDGFYRGETAQALVDGLTAQGGAMTLEDLASYEPTISEPVRGSYRNLEIVSAPPPHSGATLIEIMNMVERLDFDPMIHFSQSAETLHMMSEIFRRAYADRSQYLGDPRFVEIPVTGLISKAFASEVLNTVNPFRAEPRDYRDTPFGYPGKFDVPDAAPKSAWSVGKQKLRWTDDTDDEPDLLRSSRDDRFDRWGRTDEETTKSEAKTDEARKPRKRPRVLDEDDEFDGGHTTHLSVIDADGNMVALTQTLGNFFGSKVMIDGILLNNGRTNFSDISQANLIAPYKRPRSSLTPTLIFRDGEPFLSLGSPGAGRIIATVAQVMVNMVDFGMDVQEANDAPRFFCQKFDDHLSLEGRISNEVAEQLERYGHSVRKLGDMDLFFGGVQMTAVEPASGKLVGSADPRRGGNARTFVPAAAETGAPSE